VCVAECVCVCVFVCVFVCACLRALQGVDRVLLRMYACIQRALVCACVCVCVRARVCT